MNKNIIIALLSILILSCKNKIKATQIEEVAINDNKELQEIFNEDRHDRTGGLPLKTFDDFRVIIKRDSIRRTKVQRLIDANKLNTALDYTNAALIFQHGQDTIASGKVIYFMKKAIAMDSTINKRLLASAIDKDLMRKGKMQIYGTYYSRTKTDTYIKRRDFDSTQVSDQERIALDVETLTQQGTGV